MNKTTLKWFRVSPAFYFAQRKDPSAKEARIRIPGRKTVVFGYRRSGTIFGISSFRPFRLEPWKDFRLLRGSEKKFVPTFSKSAITAESARREEIFVRSHFRRLWLENALTFASLRKFGDKIVIRKTASAATPASRAQILTTAGEEKKNAQEKNMRYERKKIPLKSRSSV